MVGNDVVDLRDPESRPDSLHPRFDTRVFTERERATIEGSRDAARTRWKLWAAKEAAYKLARKLEPTTVFSPPRFEVTLADDVVVEHGPLRIVVEFGEHADALHAVASLGDASRRLQGWRRLAPDECASADPEMPSRAVRALLCEELARELDVPVTSLDVRKRGRVPFVWLDGEPAPIDLSLSHHGEWLGFACELAEPKEEEGTTSA